MFVLAGSGILISGRTGVKAGCQCHRSYHDDAPHTLHIQPRSCAALSACRAVIITYPPQVKAIA